MASVAPGDHVGNHAGFFGGRRVEHSQLTAHTVALILAGGNGTRLGELTRWHSKPAIPFGGIYRNIDFSLSNCVNSGIRRIAALTQYKSQSLIEHLNEGWNFLPRQLGEFIDIWPAQQRVNNGWYRGTADAVFHNLEMLRQLDPAYVLVLAGDHVYSMDYGPMLEQHARSGAGVTIACVEIPRQAAVEFGVMHCDADNRIVRFVEKPAHPEQLFPEQTTVLASMGIYVFSFDVLLHALTHDAGVESSAHDFARDVLPRLVREGNASAFAFRDPVTQQQGYWRDVGTVEAYWQAHMELLSAERPLRLNDKHWPIWTRPLYAPPAQVLETQPDGGGFLSNVILSPGCVVRDAVIRNSVLSPGVQIMPGVVIEDSVLLPNVIVGRGCHLRRVVVDSDVHVPEGSLIGHDLNSEWQAEAGQLMLTENGVSMLSNNRFGTPVLIDVIQNRRVVAA